MKRLRGFKLGRKLVHLWRRSTRRRGRSSYILLSKEKQQQQKQQPSKSTVATRLIKWGRGLCRPGRVPKPPKGHLVVYVGKEEVEGQSQRYLVPVIYFNHPLFGELLREAEDAFGFNHPGGITIPCRVSEFESVRTRVEEDASGRSGRRNSSSGRTRTLMQPWFSDNQKLLKGWEKI